MSVGSSSEDGGSGAVGSVDMRSISPGMSSLMHSASECATSPPPRYPDAPRGPMRSTGPVVDLRDLAVRWVAGWAAARTLPGPEDLGDGLLVHCRQPGREYEIFTGRAD